MMHAVTAANSFRYRRELDEMFRLRHAVFHDRLQWQVKSNNGIERDEFDELDPIYLIHLGHDEHVDASARLLPTTSPNMLSNVFPQLLEGANVPRSPGIWEISRFYAHCARTNGHGLAAINWRTSMLLCGIIEVALANGLEKMVGVHDARMERILRRAKFYDYGTHIGREVRIGNTRVIAGMFEVSERMLRALRSVFGFTQSVFAHSPDILVKRAA